MNEKLLTPEQVAERLQVTERTVYGWLRRGKLPALKLGRLWRIRPEDLEAFLESARPSAQSPSPLRRTRRSVTSPPGCSSSMRRYGDDGYPRDRIGGR